MLSSLKNLICYENTINTEKHEADRDLAKLAGLTVHTFDEVVKAGCEIDVKKQILNEPKPDSCVLFSYTSGTTGTPKGVKLTHKMSLGACFALKQHLGDKELTPDDCYLSYLPSAHAFEATIFMASMISGMKCGYFSGNLLKLTEDAATLKPTFFPSVPRLFNRIYGKIKDKFAAKGGIGKCLIKRAVKTKLNNLHENA